MNKKFMLVSAVILSFFLCIFSINAFSKPFRVAVIFPSSIEDLSWCQGMYDSLVELQEEVGMENFQFSYSENMFNLQDAPDAIRDYASEGYDLIIGHGSQYGSIIRDIAPDFPEASFAWGAGKDVSADTKNVFAYYQYSEEGGYINGILAGKITNTGVIGFIGPIRSSNCLLYEEGFKAGVLSVRPDAKININWTGSFTDYALAAESAQTHINAGADVLTGLAQMTVGAIGVARQRGVYWLGFDYDQTSLAPEIVLGGLADSWTNALREMMASIKDGVLGGKVIYCDMANGGFKIILNSDVLKNALIGKAVQDMVDGKLRIKIEE